MPDKFFYNTYSCTINVRLRGSPKNLVFNTFRISSGSQVVQVQEHGRVAPADRYRRKNESVVKGRHMPYTLNGEDEGT